jgi:2-keto-4-pentenoate hydratase
MKRILVISVSLLIAFIFALGSAWADDAAVIQDIVKSRTDIKPLSNPSKKIPDLTLEKAYKLQHDLTKALVAKGDSVGGFKAGLTSAAAQKKFKADSAMMGLLYKSGDVPLGTPVNPKDFVRLFIEVEVGYSLAKKVTAPVKDVAELKKLVKEVYPAIELPDIRFADMKSLKVADIVADAAGSAKYIVGKKMSPDKVDVSKVNVKLTLNGKTVNAGKASDALGDQWKALLWLVNTTVKNGWTIEPGQVLITGSLGRLIPGKPGAYSADFGPLGKIAFTIK